MAITTQAGTPGTFTAGDTTRFTVGDPDYPASSWELRAIFSRPGCKSVTVTASQSGSTDNFLITLSATTSAQFSAGLWNYTYRVEKQAEGSIVMDRGTIYANPNPEAGNDPSFAVQALEWVEKSIRGDLPTAQETYSVGGRDITKMSISERFELREKLKAEISRERVRDQAQQSGNSRITGYQVRFSS